MKKSNIIPIMKKEFERFFRDRRMVIMILLPAVLIYVVYSFMGTAMKSMFSPDGDYVPSAFTVNIADPIEGMLQASGINVIHITEGEIADTKDRIESKEADICIIFPVGFNALVEDYDVRTSTIPAPNIEIYYNSTVPNSSNVFQLVNAILNNYEASLSNKFDVNRGIEDAGDLATAEDVSASIISSLMPMLLLLFLYTGCVGIAPESIAGEKERGTLATLLVTPLKRSELAIGKILSLGVLSFMSGLITAIATILSLPKMMGAAAEGMLNVDIYSATDFALLALVILTTILLLVTVISIISAFAKTVKEANTAVMPLMILVMLVGVSGMFGGGAHTEPVYYLIPLYNSVQSMSGAFARDYSVINMALACVSNLVYACLGGFALTKMFNSEKVMFSR